MPLPDLVPLDVIAGRLAGACEVAGAAPSPAALGARTVFVLLYAGALEGSDRWVRPAQVVRMSDAQAAQTGDGERLAWAAASGGRGFVPVGERWYAENTRESVREVLRSLCALGAVVERKGVPASSPQPRWALTAAFARYVAATDASWTPPPPPMLVDGAGALRLARLLQRVAAEAVAYGAAHPEEASAAGLPRLVLGAREAAERLARSARQQPPAGAPRGG